MSWKVLRAGEKWKVLGDGFVRIVDVMGSDSAICAAARVSYGKGTRRVSDDKRLIHYLLRHGHTSPFEMAELKFHVRVPMDIWRQWIRHRTANVNEYSTRYSEAIDSFNATLPDEWRTQSTTNKQGSGAFLDEEIGQVLSEEEAELHERIRAFYHKCLNFGVAREQARKNLPLCTYTEAYWKIDLHNLLHFIKLRLDNHAQYEIQEYACVLGEVVKRYFPITWDAFLRYVFQSVTLSSLEVDLISRALLNGRYVFPNEWKGQNCRERDEFLDKVEKLGIDWDEGSLKT